MVQGIEESPAKLICFEQAVGETPRGRQNPSGQSKLFLAAGLVHPLFCFLIS
jgi:hypothetical protein